MGKFCSNCGAELEIDAAFCQLCGFKTELPKKSFSPPSHLDEFDTRSKSTYADNLDRGYKPQYNHVPPRKGSKSKTIIFFILLFTILVFALFGLSQFRNIFNFNVNSYSYIGDKTFSSSMGNFSSISLDLEISTGEIEIISDPLQTSPVEAFVQVFALDEYKDRIVDAKNIKESINGDKLSLIFDEEESGFDITGNSFIYNLKISIEEDFLYEFTATTSSGDININVYQILLSKLELSTSSGSINTDLIESNITTASVSLITSSGSINLLIVDGVFTRDTSWNFFTSSGSISLIMLHTGAPIIPFLQIFDIEASSGNIEIDTSLHDSIGIQVTATSSSGSVQIFDESRTAYESPNYESSNFQIHFDLVVSSGSITIT